jgi:hypothetical protein
MASKLGQGKIVDGHADPRSLKGVARRRQMRAQDDAEVARISSHLLMTMQGRQTVADELKAELIGRTACKIRRLAEQGRESLGERQLLESLLAVPFNVETNIVGPRSSGATFFVAERGDELVTDEATAPDEVEN